MFCFGGGGGSFRVPAYFSTSSPPVDIFNFNIITITEPNNRTLKVKQLRFIAFHLQDVFEMLLWLLFFFCHSHEYFSRFIPQSECLIHFDKSFCHKQFNIIKLDRQEENVPNTITNNFWNIIWNLKSVLKVCRQDREKMEGKREKEGERETERKAEFNKTQKMKELDLRLHGVLAAQMALMSFVNDVHCWMSNSSDYFVLFWFTWSLQTASTPFGGWADCLNENEILYCIVK